jgi:NAD-dependent SIR2 family protein deacetylase
MRTAVFLGAGASYVFGYPLTNELLERVLQRLDDETLFAPRRSKVREVLAFARRERKWFRERLAAFMPGLVERWRKLQAARAAAAPGCAAKGGLGISITDVLTLVDRAMQHAEGRGGIEPRETNRFRALLEHAIYEAVLYPQGWQSAPAQAALKEFRGWLAAREKPVTVITTNYDMSVDRAIFREVGGNAYNESSILGDVDFGFPWRRTERDTLVLRPQNANWRLFKLHGSVNCLRCSVCGETYLNVRSAIGSLSSWKKVDLYNECFCNDWAPLRMQLVTPSLLRSNLDPHLLGIWQSALAALRTADRWVIAGYSLPPEDITIRSLLLRAWDAHRRQDQLRIDVVQYNDPPTAESGTECVYRAFFPEANLRYRADGLMAFLAEERSPQPVTGWR